jgi:hypothetical protein
MPMPDLLRRFWGYLRTGLSAVWRFFVGGVIVAVGFASNFLDLKQSDIAIEITEIQQRSAADIDIRSSPALSKFRELMTGDVDIRFNSPFRDADPFKALQQSIDRKTQEIADSVAAVSHLRSLTEKIPADFKSTLTEDERRSRVQSSTFGASDLDAIVTLGERMLEGLNASDAKKFVDSLQDRVNAKRGLIKAAQDEVDAFRVKSEKTDAKIVVTAAITNSGDGSTTLKPQALLRADLGQGNYLDIDLKISNYDKSEVKARSASIVRFESAPISQLAPQDQERFLNFFKNTSPTNLFVVDVKNKYYRSNTIPFAQGIYEQRIFDGLKAYATSQLNRR